MSFARILYHPLNHIWLRAKEPLMKNTALQQSYRFFEIGITERGLEDIGDFTSFRWSAAISENDKNNRKNNKNDATKVRRGDELLQIHFDGHSITSADELYHTVWETFSDHVSIQSPISGSICHEGEKMEEVSKCLELDGIDDETVLMEITATEEEWKDASRENYFVTELEYLKIIEQKPRGAFY